MICSIKWKPGAAGNRDCLALLFWLAIWGAFAGSALPAAAAAAPATDTERPPNILFILTDDLGINDLGCYGRAEHHTPHLDRLAREGTRFTSAYVAQSICSPSRAALVTGRHPARMHLTTFLPGRPDAPSQKLLHPVIRQQLPLEEVTIGERFAAAGYVTGWIGKWHLGGQGFGPPDQGFSFYYAGRENSTPSATEGGKGEYDLTAQAERFLETNRHQPFLLFVSHNTPHVPYNARDELVARNARAFEPVYAAVIETMDDAIGRLLARLEALDLSTHTIVIFTSDNGGLHVPELNHERITHNTPFRAGKGYLYEGGLRVPLLVRWPGRVPTGRVTDVPLVNTDWVPTLLELAGLPVPEGRDGVSFAPWLIEQSPPPARPLFWHLPHYSNQGGLPGGALRDGDWKLIEFYEDGRRELYHLGADPGETRDLAEAEMERVETLARQLAAWRTSVGVQTNTPNPDWEPALHRALYEDTDPSRYDPARANDAERALLREWRARMDSAVAFAPPTRGANTASASARPNIVLVMADDLGMELSCYGETRIATPHLDALAAAGVRFANAYVPQASCSSARGSLLTGRWPHQNGLVGLSHLGFRLHEGQPSLPQLLREAGYFTGIVGKLHVEPAKEFSFDWMPRLEGMAPLPTRDVRWVAAQSRAFFAAARDAGKPFFWYVNYFDPHDPLDETTDQISGLPEHPLRAREVRVALPFGLATEQANRQRTAHYLNAVARLDAGVGLLDQELAAAGLATNTLFLFVSDNGIAAPRAKTTSYERGVRVPLLVRWPGRAQPGLVRQQLVMLPDVTATVLRAAEAPRPEALVGTPLQPLLRASSPPWREFLFTENHFHLPTQFQPQRTVRDARYKLVLNLRPETAVPAFELYDLIEDPWETRDLSADPALAGPRAQLLNVLQEWRGQTEDPLADPDRLERWSAARDDWDTLPKEQAGIYTVTRIPPSELEKLK